MCALPISHRTFGEDHLNAKPDITLTEANLGVLAKKKLARRCVEEPAELASMPPSIRAYRQPTVGLRAQDRPHGLKPKLSAVIGRSTQIEAIRDPTAAGLTKVHMDERLPQWPMKKGNGRAACREKGCEYR